MSDLYEDEPGEAVTVKSADAISQLIRSSGKADDFAEMETNYFAEVCPLLPTI